MYKNFFLRASMIALLLCLVLGGTSFALDADGFIAQMTKSDGSFTAATTFTLNEKPYLHLELPPLGGQTTLTTAEWNYAGYDSEGTSVSNKDTSRWLSLDNWHSVVKTGDWSVTANFVHPNGVEGSEVVNYTVTPEPMAMVLFLIGGLPIAFNLYRRKK